MNPDFRPAFDDAHTAAHSVPHLPIVDVRRYAVILAESVGWLNTVDRDLVERYLQCVVAHPPSRLGIGRIRAWVCALATVFIVVTLLSTGYLAIPMVEQKATFWNTARAIFLGAGVIAALQIWTLFARFRSPLQKLMMVSAALGIGLLIFSSGSVGWNRAKNFSEALTSAPPSPAAARVMGRYFGCAYSSSGGFDPYFVEYTLDSCSGNVCTGRGSSAHAGSFKLKLTVDASRSNGDESIRLNGEYRYASRPDSHGYVKQNMSADGTKMKGNFRSSNASANGSLVDGQLLLYRGAPPLDAAKTVLCARSVPKG